MYDWSGCRVWATLKNAFSQWTLCKCFKAQACAMCFANVATSQVIFTWPVAGLLLSVTFIIIRAQAVLQCHVTYLLSFWPDITLSVYELVRREEHHAVERSRTDWRSKDDCVFFCQDRGRSLLSTAKESRFKQLRSVYSFSLGSLSWPVCHKICSPIREAVFCCTSHKPLFCAMSYTLPQRGIEMNIRDTKEINVMQGFSLEVLE